MNELSYTPKELVFDQEGRDKLLNGIEKISEAVKSTLRIVTGKQNMLI